MKASCSVMMSPSMPCTSVMWVIRRTPSLWRVICTMMSMADAICSRIARSGRSMPGHEHERLHAAIGVARRVRVQRRDRSLVAGVHRLQHVEALGAADLADDDAVGPHAKRVAHEVADRDLAATLDVRRARLESHDVLLLQLQLDGVLDRDDALVARDERGEHVEQRGLAGAGTARDEDVHLRPHRGIEHGRDLAGQRAEADEVVDRVRRAGELSDRERRAVDRERRDDRVDTRAVLESRVDERRRLVDATSDAGDDALDDPTKLRLAGEAVRRLDRAGRCARRRSGRIG